MTKEVLYLKCPSCGESNYKQLNETTCECNIYGCKTKFFIVDSDISSELNEALHARERYNFKVADEIYINILSKTQDEKVKVSCYFGRLLSYFGVIYVKDFNGNSVITFSNYDKEYESIKESTYYNQIINSSYSYLYIDKLEELDKEYKKIKKELEKEILYDVFICVKISNKTILNPILEGYTVDSNYARDIYDELTKKGLKVFYSEKSLSGIDYDAQIYSALMRSKSILVITSKKEYLESPWVQSEWRRWVNFIKDDVKGKNSLYLFIPNNVHIELSSDFAKVQRFNDTLKLVNVLITNLTSAVKNELKVNNTEKKSISKDYIQFEKLSEEEILIKSESLLKIYLNELEKGNTFAIEDLYNLGMYFSNNKNLPIIENEKRRFLLYCFVPIKDFYKNFDFYDDEKIINIYCNVGIEFYKLNHWNEAKEIFEKLINLDVNASLYLGKMYLAGNIAGFKRDIDKAIQYLSIASKMGNSDAMEIIGSIYYVGNDVKQDVSEAIKWFEYAANYGKLYCYYKIGDFYLYGSNYKEKIKPDYEKAIKYFELGAVKGEINCQIKLWNIYFYGYEKENKIIKNCLGAFNWCHQAALQGDVNSQYWLGVMYLNGYGTGKNNLKAVECFYKASGEGNEHAKKMLKRWKLKKWVKQYEAKYTKSFKIK